MSVELIDWHELFLSCLLNVVDIHNFLIINTVLLFTLLLLSSLRWTHQGLTMLCCDVSLLCLTFTPLRKTTLDWVLLDFDKMCLCLTRLHQTLLHKSTAHSTRLNIASLSYYVSLLYCAQLSYTSLHRTEQGSIRI